ncbi:MAG TPA: UDP-3-O-(3-hydroxymyristoyl)glucosamine N-acyltransferase [Terriglobales bacterium]|nr:UDP-3-O-(3-hydroxymyristoyl)glucosamine N-acyltransferase [Terriglobales bacterium]
MHINSKTRTTQQLANQCGATLRGDLSIQITGVASIASARAGDLVFAADAANLDRALNCGASAIVTGNFASQVQTTKLLLIATNPKFAFARMAALLMESAHPEGHAESAQIDLSAQVGEHTTIGPGAVIGADVVLGDGSSVGANSVIGNSARIGRNCRIDDNVTIYSGVELKDRVIVQAGTVLGSAGFGYVPDENGRYTLFPQIGTLLIEDDVEIGANCTIDRGALDATVIRRGTKLDNMVHVGHNVEIGEDVVIAAQAGISGSSKIGHGAIVGGQVGIADHVQIEAGAILGAQSGIPSGKIIRGKGIVFWGTPARPIKQYLKELASLARLSRGKRE